MPIDPVRIFLSSPDDVGYERARAERVAERLQGLFDGLTIKTYRWEKGAYFSPHETFQAQIPEPGSFDIVVGILWSRLGSPLPPDWPKMPDGKAYASGTAFEILRAIEHRKETGNPLPDIFVYKKTGVFEVAPGDRAALRDAADALEQLEGFVAEWFVNAEEGFKAAFTPFQTTDAFEDLFDQHLRAWLKVHRSLGRERLWRIEESGSPFRGLEPFGAAHGEVFFGRRPETERARERLEDAADSGCGFLLIEGASGTGKSSLARAGLLPRLRRIDPDLRQGVFTPHPDTASAPLLELSRALFAPEALPELAQGDFATPAELAACLATEAAATPVVKALNRASAALTAAENRDTAHELRLTLLVDQLEQLFAETVPPEDRSAFAAALSAMLRTGRVQVVATLRANALDPALAVAPLKELVDTGARLSLAAPDREALAEIIRGPAAAAALAYETPPGAPGLDEVLLNDAAGADALPLLQFMLEQLYDRAADRLKAAREVLGQGSADQPVLTLTLADYRELGGIDGAIAHQADATLQRLPGPARLALPRLVRALVAGDTDAPVLLSPELAEAAPTAETRALAEALVEARLLVRDSGASGMPTLRLAHQRILTAWPAAREAVQQATTFLRVRAELQRGEARWQEAKRSGATARDLLLPPGLRLAEAEQVARDYTDELPSELRAYVETSGRRARIRQRLTTAAAALFAAIATAAGWFYLDAEANRKEALANAEEARAQREIADRNAARADQNAARAEESAARAEREAVSAHEAAAAAERSRVALLIGTANQFGRDRRFDQALGYAYAALISAEELDPASQQAAERATIQTLVNAGQAAARLDMTYPGQDNRVVAAAFHAPDGQGWLATVDVDGTVMVFDYASGTLADSIQHGAVTRDVLAVDGGLVSADRSGELRFFDPATNARTELELGETLRGIQAFGDDAILAYGHEGTGVIWWPRGGETRMLAQPTSRHPDIRPPIMRRAEITADLSRIVMAQGPNSVAIYDAETGAQLRATSNVPFFDITRDLALSVRRADQVGEMELAALMTGDVHCAFTSPGAYTVAVDAEAMVYAGNAPIENQIVLWDLEVCAEIATFDGPPQVHGILSARAAARMVVVAGDGRIWALAHNATALGEPVVDFGVSTAGYVLDPEGARLLAWTATGAAKVVELASGAVVAEAQAGGPTVAGRFSDRGNTIWLTLEDGRVRIVPARPGMLDAMISHDARVEGVIEGELAGGGAVTFGRDGAARRWHFGPYVADYISDFAYFDGTKHALTPDGAYVFLRRGDRFYRVYARTGAQAVLELVPSASQQIEVHPVADGSAAILSLDPLACIWTVDPSALDCTENVGRFVGMPETLAAFWNGQAKRYTFLDATTPGLASLELSAAEARLVDVDGGGFGRCEDSGRVLRVRDLGRPDEVVLPAEPDETCQLGVGGRYALLMSPRGWRVFEVATGAEVWRKEGYRLPRSNAVWLEDDLRFAGRDGRFLWVDLATGETLVDVETDFAFFGSRAGGEHAFLIGPGAADPKFIVHRDGTFLEVDAPGQPGLTLGPERVVVYGQDDFVRIVDVVTGEVVAALDAGGLTTQLVGMPGQQAFASVSDRGVIRVWDTEDYYSLASFEMSGRSLRYDAERGLFVREGTATGPRLIEWPDRRRLAEVADAALLRWRPALPPTVCESAGEGPTCARELPVRGPMSFETKDDFLANSSALLELSVLGNGTVLLVSDPPLPDIVVLIEYSEIDQRIVLHAGDGRSSPLAWPLSASLMEGLRRQQEALVYANYPDTGPIGYRVPLAPY